MHRIPSFALRGAALLLLTAVIYTSAHADGWSFNKRTASRRAASFGVSGAISGFMGDQVLIDGVAYRLSPKAGVFVIGTGNVPIDQLPIGRRVFASGAGTPEAGMILNLVARPATEEAPNGADMSRFITSRSISSATPK